MTSAARPSGRRTPAAAVRVEPVAPAPAQATHTPSFALALPLAFAAALASIGLLPSVRANATESASIFGAAGFIAVWTGLFFYIAGPRHRAVGLEVVLRNQHYLQACAQCASSCIGAATGARSTTPGR